MYFNLFLFVKQKQGKLTTTSSFPKCLPQLELGPKPAARNAIQVSRMNFRIQSLEPSLLPPKVCISQSQEPNSGIELRCSDVGCKHLNHCLKCWAKCLYPQYVSLLVNCVWVLTFILDNIYAPEGLRSTKHYSMKSQTSSDRTMDLTTGVLEKLTAI